MARAYRERFPDLPVVYVKGYAQQMRSAPREIIISEFYRIAQVIGVLEHGQLASSVFLTSGSSLRACIQGEPPVDTTAHAALRRFDAVAWLRSFRDSSKPFATLEKVDHDGVAVT